MPTLAMKYGPELELYLDTLPVNPAYRVLVCEPYGTGVPGKTRCDDGECETCPQTKCPTKPPYFVANATVYLQIPALTNPSEMIVVDEANAMGSLFAQVEAGDRPKLFHTFKVTDGDSALVGKIVAIFVEEFDEMTGGL